MIKTRDFLIIVVIFAIILIGIIFIVSFQLYNKPIKAIHDKIFTSPSEFNILVDDTNFDINRLQNLSVLREKIAKGRGIIRQGPPVLTSLYTALATPTDELSNEIITDSAVAENLPQYCSLQRFNKIITNWPNNVTISEVEGARLIRNTVPIVVSYNSTTSTTTSTSTKKIIKNKNIVLLQLPVLPTKLSEPVCLNSVVVGVTLGGSLILNNQAWRFRDIPPESLFGYALDGYPIYGKIIDENKLDECGGYDSENGYEYHLRKKVQFILGCYKANPVTFQL